MEKKVRVTKKRSILRTIADENEWLTGSLIGGLTIAALIFLPYFVGRLTEIMVPRLFDKSASSFTAYWTTGILVIMMAVFAIGVMVVAMTGIIYAFRRIRTCIKSCYIPLTEEEIKQLGLTDIPDYWDYTLEHLRFYFHGEIRYLYTTYYKIEEELEKQIFAMLKTKLPNMSEEERNKLKTLEVLGFAYIPELVKNTVTQYEKNKNEILYHGGDICINHNDVYILALKNEMIIMTKNKVIKESVSEKTIRRIQKNGCKLDFYGHGDANVRIYFVKEGENND